MSIAILGTKSTCLRLIEALSGLIDLVVTIDDRDDTRSRTAEVLRAAEQAGARAVLADSPQVAYDSIDAADPDVVFVAGWYRLIPDDVLARRPRGFVGLHYSRLPSYRGSAPVVWAMINGETEIGYSVFRMTSGMDEGPIAAQGAVQVGTDDTISDVLARLDELSIDHLSRLAPGIADGSLDFQAQDTTGLSYAGARSPADGQIDWSRPAADLNRFVRAQTRPYPGAHSTLEGEVVHVWAAHEDSGVPYFGQPGQVVRLIDGRPVVACGGNTGLVLDSFEADSPIRFSLLRSRFGSAQPH